MNYQHLLAIGIRLLGVYCLFKTINSTFLFYQSVALYPSASVDASIHILSVLFILVWSVTAIIMLKFPRSLASWLWPEEDATELPEFSSRGLETSLLIVLGVYILTWSIPDFVHNALNMLMIYKAQTGGMVSSHSGYDMSNTVVYQVVTVLEIFIGLFLCLRAGGLTALFYRIRGL